MDGPQAPRNDVLGITIWTRSFVGSSSRWWIIKEGWQWYWLGGYLWLLISGLPDADAVLIDHLPSMTLYEAVAFTKGFHEGQDYVAGEDTA